MCNNSAQIEIVEDNDRVRIVRYTMLPGTETGWHVHALDYVIVPYADCRVRVDLPGSHVEAEMASNKPYFRKAGVKHNVTSLMPEPFSFLEIELK